MPLGCRGGVFQSVQDFSLSLLPENEVKVQAKTAKNQSNLRYDKAVYGKVSLISLVTDNTEVWRAKEDLNKYELNVP